MFFVLFLSINFTIPAISGLRRVVDEICAHLGFRATKNGSLSPTFRDNLSVSRSTVKLEPTTILHCGQSQNGVNLSIILYENSRCEKTEIQIFNNNTHNVVHSFFIQLTTTSRWLNIVETCSCLWILIVMLYG
jgi:hypothetical protein